MAQLFFAKVPPIRHLHVIFEIYKRLQERRHAHLSVAAGRRGMIPPILPVRC
ncbi:hypothetical protein J2J97_00690 [Rhizobium bangladeshense]|uniref:hypothetical protein n=1 Tax=Rhizobium bangladeshense TaxID=1138189 RepID=UPI001A97E2CB|nr:hypothetical protein [Rhizobium bangladeshense]QSY94495.1 hypothetical protein J2J97_00690 [Rhizobium bangladeshense]